MAYREVGMWEILEVLRRVHRGEPYAAIQRATGHTRKTAQRYVRVARAAGWDAATTAPDEALAAAVGQRLKPGRKLVATGDAAARLTPHREQIRQWLAPPPDGGRGLRLAKVRTLLGRQGVPVPYSSLHRFAVRHCGFHEGAAAHRADGGHAAGRARRDRLRAPRPRVRPRDRAPARRARRSS